MIGSFMNLHPVYQGLLATLFTYGITMLGASLVFFFKTVDQRLYQVPLSEMPLYCHP